MDNSKPKKFRIKKSPRLNMAFFTLVAITVIFYLIGLSTVSIRNEITKQTHQKRLDEAISFCDSLFNENLLKLDNVSADELKDCDDRLVEIGDENETKKLREMVSDALKYIEWLSSADEWFEDGTVKSSITEKDLTSLAESQKSLNKGYINLTSEKLNALKTEHKKMKDAKNAVNYLFTSTDRKTAKGSIKRSDYNNAKKLVDSLAQNDLKKEYESPLKEALKSIEEQERIAREKAEKARREREERERKIAASWHKLNLSPYYINQYTAQIYNGCEAASLLMALKYKGYARGTSFKTFVDEMPKSETDPNEGFYLSIYDLEPKTEAHWIAPAPLAAYGRTTGAIIVNATGWSLDRLDEEVKNGNPVVIYTTYAFRDPKNYNKGVPKNLHVMVLSGYNSYTGEQVFYDPWPANGVSPVLSKARAESLYNAVGKRAIVIK